MKKIVISGLATIFCSVIMAQGVQNGAHIFIKPYANVSTINSKLSNGTDTMNKSKWGLGGEVEYMYRKGMLSFTVGAGVVSRGFDKSKILYAHFPVCLSLKFSTLNIGGGLYYGSAIKAKYNNNPIKLGETATDKWSKIDYGYTAHINLITDANFYLGLSYLSSLKNIIPTALQVPVAFSGNKSLQFTLGIGLPKRKPKYTPITKKPSENANADEKDWYAVTQIMDQFFEASKTPGGLQKYDIDGKLIEGNTKSKVINPIESKYINEIIFYPSNNNTENSIAIYFKEEYLQMYMTFLKNLVPPIQYRNTQNLSLFGFKYFEGYASEHYLISNKKKYHIRIQTSKHPKYETNYFFINFTEQVSELSKEELKMNPIKY